MSLTSRAAVIALAAGVAMPAAAQTPAPPASSSPQPTAPPAPALPFAQVASTVAPGTWTWAAKLTTNGQPQDFGTRTLTLQKSKGADSWLLLDAQSNPMATMSDSLVLASADFATMRRSLLVQSPMGAITLAMAFTPDSVTGSMSAGGQTQPVALKNVKGAVSSDGLLLLALAKLPLADGWTGRMDLFNPQGGGTIPLTFAVKRSEKVTVPAGSFDTWVVETTSGPGNTTFYVAKGGPVVRIVTAVPQMGGTVEATLVK